MASRGRGAPEIGSHLAEREVCADISEAVANGQAIGQVDDGDDAIRPLVRPGAEVSCLDALYRHLRSLSQCGLVADGPWI